MKRSFTSELWGAPNILSMLRILSPYIAIALIGSGYCLAGLAVGTVGGLTDLFDGYIARKTGKMTRIGAFLDQLGDLIFEYTLMIFGIWIGLLPLFFVFVYLFREFVVLFVRSFMALSGKTVPSSFVGKAKTSFIQYSYFPLYLGYALATEKLAPTAWVQPLHILAIAGIGIGLALSLVSGYRYLTAFVESYLSTDKEHSG